MVNKIIYICSQHCACWLPDVSRCEIHGYVPRHWCSSRICEGPLCKGWFIFSSVARSLPMYICTGLKLNHHCVCRYPSTKRYYAIGWHIADWKIIYGILGFPRLSVNPVPFWKSNATNRFWHTALDDIYSEQHGRVEPCGLNSVFVLTTWNMNCLREMCHGAAGIHTWELNDIFAFPGTSPYTRHRYVNF